MTTYGRKTDAHQRYSSYKWKAPLVFAGFVIAAFVCIYFELFWERRYPRLPHVPYFAYTIAVIGGIFSFGFIFAVHYGLQNMMSLRIELTAEGILRSGGPRKDLFLPWGEIVGYTESKQGILLHTTDRMRRIAIPTDLQRYAEVRKELADKGITQISREESDRSWSWR